MTQETVEKNIDRIPPEMRDPFELVLMEIMISNSAGKNINDIDKEEKHKLEGEWVVNYAQKVGKIIDNKENKEIRDYIINGEYSEASKLVLESLGLKY